MPTSVVSADVGGEPVIEAALARRYAAGPEDFAPLT
jgi:hypothetical protein